MAAKSLMIQGTMSSAGKSFVTAGLCRVFAQDGYRTAPFKSQNMALNSYITSEGLEMGRAQVMQAEAAGVEPQVRMNPILLKPTSHTGSQVIIMGESAGNMDAASYYRKKASLMPVVKQAYEELAAQYDIIVIEGAGSPAEINLRKNDIVNMGMAELADAPVLLVGDIDRGGVFASLYGTVALLQQEEQARIRGLIINKFRGDVEILRPGLRMLEERIYKPVVGVIPMERIDIDDEDSLSERLTGRKPEAGLQVAVIRLPRISNFTDFNTLERLAGVEVYYVSRLQELGAPDLVILPGSKSTMDDMAWLRSCGLEAAILKLSASGVPVMGICGGFQLLGEQITDECGAEGTGSIRGMGLLPVRTRFAPEKTRSRTSGAVQADTGLLSGCRGLRVSGYEIHMGLTEPDGDCEQAILLDDGSCGGLISREGLVFGTYLHGIFDSGALAGEMLGRLAAKKGITLSFDGQDWAAYKESQYDKLAALIRKSLDMDYIYKLMGLSHRRNDAGRN